MKHKLRSFSALAIIIMAFAASFLFIPSVSAVSCAGVSTALLDCGTGVGNGAWGILSLVLNILVTGVGIAAVGGIIYGAILYTSAGDDYDKVQKAKEILRNVVIGLVAFLGLYGFIQFLIPGGVFDRQPSVVASKPTRESAFELSIGSWNTYKYNNHQTVASGVSSLFDDGFTVIGIQEASFHTDSLNKLACATCKYGMYPTSGAPKKTAILWNKSILSPVSQGSIYGSTLDGVKKYFVWIKFKHIESKKEFYVINTHFPFDAEENGKLKDTAGGRAYVLHMKNLVNSVRSFQNHNIPIFLTGDFNADYRHDNCSVTSFPCVALSRNLDVKSGWEYLGLGSLGSSTGTAGSSRIIDYVFSWNLNYVSYQSMRIAYGGSSRDGWKGSDHKPIVLKLTIKPDQDR